EVVLRVALVELLERGLAEAWMARAVDPRLGAVDAGHPGAFGALDVPVRVELGRVLAEVPHVAARVLRVPVGGALLEPAKEVEPVADSDAGNALDLPGLVGDDDEVAGLLAVLHAGIDPVGAGEEREPRIVDPYREARGRRHGRRSCCVLRETLARDRA